MEGSANPMQQSEGEREDFEACDWYNFVVCVFVVGGICILGLAGNLTSFFVLLKHKTETVAIFQLQCICVSDSLLLLASLVVYCLPAALAYTHRQGPTDNTATSYMIYVWPLAMVAHTLTIWLTVLVTFTRYGAVCRPQEAYRTQNLCRTKIYILVVIVLSVLFNIPRFFEHHRISFDHSPSGLNSSGYNATPINLGDSQIYQILYSNLAYFLVMYIVPLSSLSYMNFRLITSLKELRKKRITLMRKTRPITSDDDHITKCVIIIVCVFIVCQTPALVNQIFWAALSNTQRDCGHFHFYYTKLSDVLVVLNSSCNIVIYCLCGRHFRAIFMEVLCGHCRWKTSQTSVCSTEDAIKGTTV